MEAGVIRINGAIAGSESESLFSSNGRVLCQWERHVNRHAAWSIHTVLYGPTGLCFPDNATGRAPGASRLIVGDAANGDSIVTSSIGSNPGLCANGDVHLVENPIPLLAGTGRDAGAERQLHHGPMFEPR